MPQRGVPVPVQCALQNWTCPSQKLTRHELHDCPGASVMQRLVSQLVAQGPEAQAQAVRA
jgi:hypothetical protein